jgi:hypothetical protein
MAKILLILMLDGSTTPTVLPMAGMEACNAAKTAIYTQYGEIQKWVGERVAAADARPGSVRVSGPEGGGAPYAYCIEGAM